MSRRDVHRSFALALALSAFVVSGTNSSGQEAYSEGGWATLHRSGANRRDAGAVPLSDRYATWHALEGAAILTAPTLSPDGQTFYVTTGRAVGHSNLHAFRIDGEALWHAEPWENASRGIDPCAVLSSPIVDREGDLYVSDCNQLFAFHADGGVKWIVPLPPPQAGDWQPSPTLPINALTTALFTRDGHVAGITNFGDVVVVDRETGDSLALPFRLPGLLPPASTTVPMTESVFGEGLMAPEIREWAWQLLFGGHLRSANTPAVDPATGRIFVAASSTNEGQGALYALDLRATNPATRAATGATLEVRIAHATDIGLGSGSSPALSPKADRVYVSDEAGIFYAIDARDGKIAWQVPTRSTAAAASVGSDGTIYSLQANGPALIAISPDGRIKWQSDLTRLTAQALPPSWLLGDPVAIGNGNPTAVDGFVLLPVIYGYETTLGRRIPWPVLSRVVAIDAGTGEGIANLVSLPDDSTGITVALPDGTLIHSLGTAITSAVSPLATIASWLLPGDLEPLEPVGGLQVSRPETIP